MSTICGEKNTCRKARWLQILVNDVLEASVLIPVKFLKASKRKPKEEDDGADKHRISAKDLDALRRRRYAKTSFDFAARADSRAPSFTRTRCGTATRTSY